MATDFAREPSGCHTHTLTSQYHPIWITPAGIDYETAKGGVVLASGAAGLFGGSEGEEGGSLRRGRHPKGK